jgi:hypothetical protein
MTKTALALAAACAAALLVGLPPAVAGPGSVTCTDAFSGTARDLRVPADNFCDLSGATITHDVIVEPFAGVFAEGLTVGADVVLKGEGDLDLGGAAIGHDVKTGFGASLHFERTTIGHDLSASEPQTFQTGMIAPDSPGGPVRVGHDVEITGSPAGFDFVFDGICNLTVGHDFRMTNRSVTLGVGLGGHCAQFGRPANTIGHDLIVTGNSALSGVFGPSSIEVGHNVVGHDLVFTANSAVPGGHLDVSDNVVRHDAVCAGNDPAPAPDDPGDGPNIVGHQNTCG